MLKKVSVERLKKCQYLNQLRKLVLKAIFGILNSVRAFSKDFAFILF